MASATANSGAAVALAVAALLGSAAPAHARPADGPAEDKATAEALFTHAKSLMKEGKLSEACPKFAESLRLDAGIGTMLYLADCYERNGQSASAWAEFLEAAGVAHAAGQGDREKKARERAAALEPRLSRVSIALAPGADVSGIVVKRDGQPVGRVLWGTPVPLDPGEHVVEAAAPGKLPWSHKVLVSSVDTGALEVVVPALVDAPPPEPVKATVERPPVPAPVPALEKPRPAPGVEPRRPPPPAPPPPEPASSPRVAGYSMLGIGLATAAVGGALGAVALIDKGDAAATCRADNVCTPSAAVSRSHAVTMATASSAALIAGGGLFTVGMVILIATRPASSIDRQSLRVSPLVGAGLGGLAVGGPF
jgi:hypothetical protein